MNCCNNVSCTNGIGDFFSKEAKKFLKRYKKKGLERSQKHLIEGLLNAGIDKKSILEIGCGVGYLHSRLLLQGAKSATGIDISEEMLRYAKEFMKEIGLEKETSYHTGDFVEISESIKKAEITILDKVICCYPEVESLVEKSIQKTDKVYAFTLPRNVSWVKYPVLIAIQILKIIRFNFHPYFHEHEVVNSRLIASGFKNIYQNHTFLWETYVFTK
ncbi:MAG: class I SAM-dependent methyltransferase [Spirochaetia bacterium]|nr:class I SAM-dependent methyltransferase [Spirochaetia bacterium]